MSRSPVRTLVTFAALVCASVAAADDRYIVQFQPGKFTAGKAAVALAGGRIARDLAAHDALAAHLPAAAVRALERNPNVEYVEADPQRHPMAQSVPYGITMVQAPQVSANDASSRKVCIIDSGYSLGHEDLQSSLVTGAPNGGAGPWYQDGSGHGTHVAGTIAALNNTTGVVGVVPNGELNLHIVRVFGDDGTWAYASDLVAALDQCTGAGANVVSMSLGGTFKSRTEDRAFRDAYNAGILPVAAAGNDGNTRNSYPASYNSVISVAAVDSAGIVADFSQQNSQVELAAPGVAVRSTVPMGSGLEGSVSVGGTAYASNPMEGSPTVSASGALVNCGDGSSTCAGATGKVCLIQRGTITFAEKVAACETGGGVAAIIYNNTTGPLLGTLGGAVTAIPSVGVSDIDGAAMLGQLGAVASVAIAPSNYAEWDGTSMATPHVSGVAALVWSRHTACSNAELRNALTATALDLGAAGRDPAYGFGLVQAEEADIYLANNGCGGGGGGGGGGGSCPLLPSGASCTSNSDCCSNSCKGRPGAKSCK